MAITRDIFNLSGKLGNVIYYKREGQQCARRAPEEVKLSEESKKSGTDFGMASSAGCLVRTVFGKIIKNWTDNGLVNRLNKKFIEVINTGPAALKGERQVTDGDLDLLRGFELNRDASLSNLMYFDPKTRIEAPGKINFSIPEFEVRHSFKAPESATTAVVQIACGVFDFPGKCGYALWADDIVLSLDGKDFESGSIDFPLDDTEGKVLITCAGVYFRNSLIKRFKNMDYQAGKLIDVVLIRDGKIVKFQYPEPVEPAVDPDDQLQRISWKFGKLG